MMKLLSCRYNMDTNRVEARFEDGVDHAGSPHRIVIPSCRNRQALLYLVSRGARYAVFVQVQRDSTF